MKKTRRAMSSGASLRDYASILSCYVDNQLSSRVRPEYAGTY